MMQRTAVLFVALMMLVLSSAVAHADGTLLGRVDMPRGGHAGLTSAWLDASGWELWSFSQPDFPVYEAGRLWPVKACKSDTLLLGGYVSWWDKSSQLFAEPFWVYNHELGSDWKFESAGGAYIPLNNGPWVLYTNQVAVSHPVRHNVRVGVAVSNCWQEGTGNTLGVGPKVEISGPGGSSLSLRYLWGVNNKTTDTARIEGSLKINF